jgi:uncharacterized protein
MLTLLSTVFVASILGSVHCVGMCGPFALLATTDPQHRRSVTGPAVLYSIGRLITYASVGAIFGTFGYALSLGVNVLGGVSLTTIQRVMTTGAGILMIAIGTLAIARYAGINFRLAKFDRLFHAIIQPIYKRLKNASVLQRSFLIGATSCLLPCGWLYTFAIVAAGTGNPLSGALVMTVFWAGTVPIMLALMCGAKKLGQPILKRLPALTAVLVIIVGICTITYRSPIAMGIESVSKDSPESLVENVKGVDQSELPCCCHN